MPDHRQPAYSIQPLSTAHDRGAFASGVDALDRYLHHQARQDVRRLLSACFVLLAPDGALVGYYTLSATSIVLADLPEDVARRLLRYPAIPATLLGRLAVHHGYRRQGLGQSMLIDAFRRSLASIGSFAVVVDAKEDAATLFYERFGFRRLEPVRQRLFMPMAEIATLFA